MSMNLSERPDNLPADDDADPAHRTTLLGGLVWLILVLFMLSGVLCGLLTFVKLFHELLRSLTQ